MAGFLATFNLEFLVDGIGLQTNSDNIEDIYSELTKRPECVDRLKELESVIVKVMSEFQLPDEPTVYDYLLLSLREKDLIATFNWDPLLMQAYKRVRSLTTKLPQICFLHGNVAQGHSTCKHKYIGCRDSFCPKCHKRYDPVPLLYPVKHKDYVSDWWIQSQWKALSACMHKAGALTIFGYSAPKSDVEAIRLLKKGWGKPEEKNIQQTEIIDLKDSNQIEETWRDFIYNGHCSVYNSFYESKLALYPRRTVEADIERFVCNHFISSRNSCLKEGMDFLQLSKHLEPVLQKEGC